MIRVFLQELIRALYPVWGTVGIIVALNYGAFSKLDWQANGGSWRTIARDWWKVLWFVLRGCAMDVYCFARNHELTPTPPAFKDWGYSPGHLLRFFIMLSFMTAGVFGFWLINVDRSEWWWAKLVVVAAAVGMSIVAGLGHLFIAWRFHPRRWRWLCMACMIYVIVSLVIDHWYWN